MTSNELFRAARAARAAGSRWEGIYRLMAYKAKAAEGRPTIAPAPHPRIPLAQPPAQGGGAWLWEGMHD